MKLAFDAEVETFRAELSAWLDEHTPQLPPDVERTRSSAHIPDWARAWQRTLFDAGYLVPGNPPEYGGRNASLLEQFVHLEELGRRRLTASFNPQGISIITPSILAFGTEAQKQRWAIPILRAEMTAALGMSEPDAGSDLAGLRTRARLEGDRFVVDGQKVWTSGAHDADVIFAFVRTDPDAPKHKGISVLLIPTDTPGVTCKPFGSIVGPEDLDFNEVFFDEVEVPVDHLVGELHQGWRVANGSLGHERSMLWLNYAERLSTLLTFAGTALTDRGLADDALALDWYGRMATDLQALRLLGYRALGSAQHGAEAKEQSILKLFGSEAIQAGALAMLETLGPDGLDPEDRIGPLEPLYGDHGLPSWWELYLRSFANTIAGGTSQIQRNIVSERVLGLPR